MANQVLVTFIVGIYADSAVAHDGFRTLCSDGDVIAGELVFGIGDGILYIVEFTLYIFVLYFFVAQGSFSFRVPVDHSCTTVDKPFIIEVIEYLDNSFI